MPVFRQLLVAITALLTAVSVAGVAGCARPVDGRAVYATDTSEPALPLVKTTGLPALIPTAAEIGPVVNAADLQESGIYDRPDALPDGVLSDHTCTAVMVPNSTAVYSDTGFIADYGQLVQGADRDVVSGVVAFSTAEEATGFVHNQVRHWRDCVGRTFTVKVDDQQVNWTASGPGRSYGIDIAVRKQEAGHGFACGRATGARSNIAADVMVCSADGDSVGDQAAKVVSLILAKIPH